MEEQELCSLIVKAQNNVGDAMEMLLQYFKPKVTAISREYFLVGADFDDLIQEGMIGLYKAIGIYNPNKNHNFSAFASLCIHRQLQNAVKNANRKKNIPLNQYLPINHYGGVRSKNGEETITVVIVDDSDIESEFINKEMNAIVLTKVKEKLNDSQFKLLKMFLNGESYSNMANRMNLSTKQVDNMIQSIKKKLKTIKGEI